VNGAFLDTFLAVKRLFRRYEIDDDRARLDFERVHGWLTTAYWSPGVSRERVEKAAQESSLVVGAYRDGVQVGYLRVVSDRTTFAWVCDVFVDEAHRGRGLARAMLRFALEHPEYQDLKRWLLATADAHGVYQAEGFEPLPVPERWMMRGRPVESNSPSES
jgi:GNAT superfamily N-acetyltransferase